MQTTPTCSDGTTLRIAALLERLGGDLSRKLDLALESEDDRELENWLIASCLLGQRLDEAQVEAVLRSLRKSAHTARNQMVSIDPSALAQILANANCKNTAQEAAKLATKLKRAAQSLELHYSGSLTRLARQAESGDDLAGRIAALASGIGAATVLHFLRPLREVWRLADEIPLHPAARTAAVHLGLLREGEDSDGAPSVLRMRLGSANEASGQTIAFADLEAALFRLGQRACLRERKARCPMLELCPRDTCRSAKAE